MDRITKLCAVSFSAAVGVSVLAVALGAGFALRRFVPQADGPGPIDVLQCASVFGAVLGVIAVLFLFPRSRPHAVRIAAFCFAAALAFMPTVYVALAFLATDPINAAKHIFHASAILAVCIVACAIGLGRIFAARREDTGAANRVPVTD